MGISHDIASQLDIAHIFFSLQESVAYLQLISSLRGVRGCHNSNDQAFDAIIQLGFLSITIADAVLMVYTLLLFGAEETQIILYYPCILSL